MTSPTPLAPDQPPRATSGIILVLLSALAGAIFYRIGVDLVKPSTGITVREFTMALYTWATLIALVPVLMGPQRSGLRMAPGLLGINLALGAVFGLSVILAFDSSRRMDPSSASFLFRTSVLFTLLLGVLVLKEKLSASEACGALLVVVGIATMGMQYTNYNPIGMAEALGNAVLASIYQLLAKRTLGQVPAPVVTVYRNLAAFLVFLAFTLVAGASVPPWQVATSRWVLLAAFMGPYLHSLLYLMALSRMELVRASVLAQTQPIFVLLLGLLLGAKAPTPRELIADGFIILGVLVLVRVNALRPKARPKPQS